MKALWRTSFSRKYAGYHFQIDRVLNCRVWSAKDVNLHVWDAATGNTHAIYESLPVNALVGSPDGTRMATVCSRGVLRVWRVL
jgi:WD40 repeat protein